MPEELNHQPSNDRNDTDAIAEIDPDRSMEARTEVHDYSEDQPRPGNDLALATRENALEGEIISDESLQEYEYRKLGPSDVDEREGEIISQDQLRFTDSSSSAEARSQDATERNEHWEGVIHYQSLAEDRPELPSRHQLSEPSEWDGVQRTRTTERDAEAEHLSTPNFGGRSSDRDQEPDRSTETAFSR